ncbi:hypothetical protein [Leucobacter chromiiresistens]|uniref:hypothetical protein n=1 Tax=Leucobacter chromiiresistens TaxID=1079994 RepID=UPI00128EA379|nr:hypothetical protein [Leucobacter chromiiresistens]
MSGSTQFLLVNPEVISISSHRHDAEGDELIWETGIAPEGISDMGGRVVFGTLQAGCDSGGGAVIVASIFRQPEGELLELEAFEEAFVDSDALETLYDIARASLRQVLSFIEVQIDLPRKAPEPQIGYLTRQHEDRETEELYEEPGAS